MILAACVGMVGLGCLLLINECASGGAMAGVYQDCQCRGYEVEMFDRTEADGPRKTGQPGATE